jgi:hypothetical protein
MKDYVPSMTELGDAPWGGGLRTVVIGEGVTYIGQSAFKGNSNLKEVTVSAANPPNVGAMAFNMSPIGSAILRVPQNSVNTYKTADVWKDFGYINPSTVTFNYAQNDVTPTTQLVSYGDTINEPADPVRAGFVFEYWYSDAPPSNPFIGVMPSAWDFSTVVQSDMTLIAKWTSSTSVLVKNSPNVANIAVRQTGRVLKISTPNRAAARYGVELYSVSGKRQKVSPVYHTDGLITVALPHVAAGSYILRVGDGKSGTERRVLVR